MPLPRRTSLSTHPSPSQESGVYPSVGRRIEELEDDFPDLPSRMPGACNDAIAPPPPPPPPPPPAIPDLVFNAPPPRNEPMFRTSSSANIAAVRGPAELEEASAPDLAPIVLDFVARRAAPPPPPAPIAESGGFDSFEEEPVDLKLDINAAPKRLAAFETMSGAEMPPASQPTSQVAPTPVSSTQTAHDPRPGVVAFAGYGLPPESLGGTPAYALRVITRKWTLRDDLRIARLRRIRDVSLYEAALECADESAVTKGLAVIAATVIGGVSAIAAAAAFLL